MVGISQSKENAQEKLENLFVKATTEFRKWLQAVGKPEALLKILKEVIWSLQFAAASQSEAVVTLWFDLMVLMRTTRDHPVREWTYEVLVEFTSMRHLIEIVAKHSGFRTFQLEFYGLDANPVLVSSGAKTIVETMLVRLALCISQRFPEYAAAILLDHKAAGMISRMIENDVLSKEFRKEVSKRYLKLCNSIKKQVESSRPPQHQRVNQLRNPHEYHSYLRQQQHHKHSQHQKHPQPQEEQQLVPKEMAPEAQAHHATRPQNQQVSGEQQPRKLRQQKTQPDTQAKTTSGLDVQEQHLKQSKQKHREGQRQQKRLEKSSADQMLKTQQLNPRDRHLLEVIEEEERARKKREAEQALKRQWELGPAPRFFWEVQLHQARKNPAQKSERNALEHEVPINEELDSLLGELHRVCFAEMGKQEAAGSDEPQKQEPQKSKWETTEIDQQNQLTAGKQLMAEEAEIVLEECDLGSNESIEVPGVGGKSPLPNREIHTSPGDSDGSRRRSSRQEPPDERQFCKRTISSGQEPEEPPTESKLLKLLREVPQPQELWPQALLEDRDRIFEFQSELKHSLESQQKQHEQLVEAAALTYKSRLDKLRLLQARFTRRRGTVGPQPTVHVDSRWDQLMLEFAMNPLPRMKPSSKLDAAAPVNPIPAPTFRRARPLQEWQLPCEELILLQMEQGRLKLPPGLAAKYRNRPSL